MMLFFDIDGTLFDSRHRLAPSVRPAMEAAHRNGHLLVINTGRTLCNMDHRLDGFPLDGWVMGCGTRIIWKGETLQSFEYSREASLKLRNLFREMKVPVVYECDTAMYFDPENDCHPSVRQFREFARARGIERNISDTDPEFRTVKMFCFTDRDMIPVMARRTGEAGMPFSAINRQPEGWELVPEGFSKGKGIDFLRNRLGYSRDECYAFGDSENDLPMLEHAGHSIAMGNAPETVKSVCTYVTDLPEKDGIEKAMRHFGLI